MSVTFTVGHGNVSDCLPCPRCGASSGNEFYGIDPDCSEAGPDGMTCMGYGFIIHSKGLPELNVSNTNARMILQTLGWENGDLQGSSPGQTFMEQLAVHINDLGKYGPTLCQVAKRAMETNKPVNWS